MMQCSRLLLLTVSQMVETIQRPFSQTGQLLKLFSSSSESPREPPFTSPIFIESFSCVNIAHLCLFCFLIDSVGYFFRDNTTAVRGRYEGTGR